MSTFLQLHLLTTFAPANLNRDDLGRPKTASFGGVNRGRISSQCMKRSLRTNDTFTHNLQKLGTRTRYLGEKTQDSLINRGFDENEALEYTLFLLRINYLLAIPSEDKAEKTLPDLQISFVSQHELDTLDKVIDFICDEKEAFLEIYKQKTNIYKAFKTDKANGKQQELKSSVESKLKFISNDNCSPDVALFGRMMASNQHLNIDAALQMNHPITVGSAQTEIDYFTAIDDLADDLNKTGASHINVQYYNSGTFYTYLNVNLDLLAHNLGDIQDKELVIKGIICNLIDSITTITPSGKQNAFASRNFADFVVLEIGDQTPRSLVGAFYKAVSSENQMQEAIERLLSYKTRLDNMYGYKLDVNDYISSLEINKAKNQKAKEVSDLEELKNNALNTAFFNLKNS